MEGLPNEILLSIFEELTNLDDVGNLARASRRLGSFFSGNRTNIHGHLFRSSGIHANDVHITRMEAVYESFADEYETHRDMEIADRPKCIEFEALYETSAKDLQLGDIGPIAKRWSLVSKFFNLYQDPKMRRAYADFTYPYTTEKDASWEDMEQKFKRLTTRVQLPLPQGWDFENAPAFDIDVKMRFYQAMSRYWRAVDLLKLARVLRYKTETSKFVNWDKVYRAWHSWSDPIPLQLDTLEVFDFVYGFLSTTLFSDAENIAGWKFLKSEDQSLMEQWDTAMQRVRSSLTPLDIFDLLQWSTLSSMLISYEHLRSLTTLRAGARGSRGRYYELELPWWRESDRYKLDMMEKSVCFQLSLLQVRPWRPHPPAAATSSETSKAPEPTRYADVWPQVRLAWPAELRFKCLSWSTTGEEFIQLTKQYCVAAENDRSRQQGRISGS